MQKQTKPKNKIEKERKRQVTERPAKALPEGGNGWRETARTCEVAGDIPLQLLLVAGAHEGAVRVQHATVFVKLRLARRQLHRLEERSANKQGPVQTSFEDQ